MAEALKEMELKAKSQAGTNSGASQPPENSSFMWLWITLGVIASVVILGGIVYFVVKK
ncbi:hypothetical protein DSO57_1006943 [Entomophthora muscae]|uniref:Uncharacterized protein n=1 Tax=Entomophthora muscae TaxID=34485 RepID=A0ACC2SWJ7_9FUNG|nr:hypothetical protein DSO57_1006943 [Entomophthora muscae]